MSRPPSKIVSEKDKREKALFGLRVLQVMPTREEHAINLQTVLDRLVKHFAISDDSTKTKAAYQIKTFKDIGVLLESNVKKRHVYLNSELNLELGSSDLDTLSALSKFVKMAEKLFPHASEPVKHHLDTLTSRFQIIHGIDEPLELSARYAYADFLLMPEQTAQREVNIRLLERALSENTVVSILYKPRDTEKLKVDVGLPLGIVQKSNIQTLVLLARAKAKDYSYGETLRISLDRILRVHFRKQDGELERFEPNQKEPSEIWHDPSNHPEQKFAEFCKRTEDGLLVRTPNKQKIDSSRQTEETNRVQLVAHIHVHLKTHLETLKISADQKFKALEMSKAYTGTSEDESWYELTASVVPSENLEWWIMSWAERIVLIEPQELKEKISGRIKNAAANYMLNS